MKFFSPSWRWRKGGNFNFCNINFYMLTLLLEKSTNQRNNDGFLSFQREFVKSPAEKFPIRNGSPNMAFLAPAIKHFLYRFKSASHLSLDKAGQGWAQKAPPPRIWPKLQRWTNSGPTPRIHWQVPPKDLNTDLCYCYTKPPKLMTSSFVLFSSKTNYHFFQFYSPRHYKSVRTPLQECLILIYAKKSTNCLVF